MIGNILKLMLTKENYLAFKHEQGLRKEVHVFELPGLGVFSDASTVKPFCVAHSCSNPTLEGYDDSQKLFVTHD